MLGLYRSDTSERGTTITFNLHHGFTAGRLAGGKALAMQRWLWTHNCDIAIQGHSHNNEMQFEKIEGVSDRGEPYEKNRIGLFCGSYLHSAGTSDGTYSENKGYLPQGQGHWEIHLRADEENPHQRMRVEAYL
jgi:hypothetical protein